MVQLLPTPEELKMWYANVNRLPVGPSYDDVAGWSKRTAVGVFSNSPTDYVEKDSKVTIDLGGKPFTFVMNSGFLVGKPTSTCCGQRSRLRGSGIWISGPIESANPNILQHSRTIDEKGRAEVLCSRLTGHFPSVQG